MFNAVRSLLFDFAGRLRDRFGLCPTSRRFDNGSMMIRAWPKGTNPGPFPEPRSLPLPLLTHLAELGPTDWLRESLKTFGRNVASFLPGHFPAYARVYHPFELRGDQLGATSSWRDLPALAREDISDPLIGGQVAMNGVDNAQARFGTLPLPLIEALIEHLRPATGTPEKCYFAVWEGFGDLAIAEDMMPKLELPNREYHVFSGPLAAARTSYAAFSFGNHHRSANLWWPADQAWCVATEVDSVWTHVGGSRACIDAVLADPRLETMETFAQAEW